MGGARGSHWRGFVTGFGACGRRMVAGSQAGQGIAAQTSSPTLMAETRGVVLFRGPAWTWESGCVWVPPTLGCVELRQWGLP